RQRPNERFERRHEAAAQCRGKASRHLEDSRRDPIAWPGLRIRLERRRTSPTRRNVRELADRLLRLPAHRLRVDNGVASNSGWRALALRCARLGKEVGNRAERDLCAARLSQHVLVPTGTKAIGHRVHGHVAMRAREFNRRLAVGGKYAYRLLLEAGKDRG